MVMWIKHAMLFMFWITGALYMNDNYGPIIPVVFTIVYVAAEAFMMSLAYPIEQEEDDDEE